MTFVCGMLIPICVILTAFDYLSSMICLFVYMVCYVMHMSLCVFGALDLVILVNLLRLFIKLPFGKKRKGRKKYGGET